MYGYFTSFHFQTENVSDPTCAFWHFVNGYVIYLLNLSFAYVIRISNECHWNKLICQFIMAIHFYSATLWHGLVLCGIDYDAIYFMEVATRPIESLLDRSLSDDSWFIFIICPDVLTYSSQIYFRTSALQQL